MTSGLEQGPELLSPILYANASITASCAPTYIDESTATAVGTFTSSLVITASGGLGTLSYAWTTLSTLGDGVITITSPTASTTALSYTGLNYAGAYGYALLRCTITDISGSSTYVNVSVNITRTSGGGIIP